MTKNELLHDKLHTATVLAETVEAEHQVDVPHVSILRDLDLLMQTVQSATRTAVESLRASGATWQDIGQALGVSRQAAQQLYGR